MENVPQKTRSVEPFVTVHDREYSSGDHLVAINELGGESAASWMLLGPTPHFSTLGSAVLPPYRTNSCDCSYYGMRERDSFGLLGKKSSIGKVGSGREHKEKKRTMLHRYSSSNISSLKPAW